MPAVISVYLFDFSAVQMLKLSLICLCIFRSVQMLKLSLCFQCCADVEAFPDCLCVFSVVQMLKLSLMCLCVFSAVQMLKLSLICLCVYSAVQMLKLALMRVQADRDLSRKEKKAVSEKLSLAVDAYETEINVS